MKAFFYNLFFLMAIVVTLFAIQSPVRAEPLGFFMLYLPILALTLFASKWVGNVTASLVAFILSVLIFGGLGSVGGAIAAILLLQTTFGMRWWLAHRNVTNPAPVANTTVRGAGVKMTTIEDAARRV